jgi:hypothetical protein
MNHLTKSYGPRVVLGMAALVAIASLATSAFAGKPVKVVCGNGIAQASEACDGADLRSQTCQSVGFDGGKLACAANCTFDTTGCLSFLRFIDNGDGTVTDLDTGLQWELKDHEDGSPDYWNPHDADNEYTWGNLPGCGFVGCANGTLYTDFLARLNNHVSDGTNTVYPGFAGHSDWRLPTIEELATIVDYTSNGCKESVACFPDAFGATDKNIFAASSTHPLDGTGYYAWAIYFHTGYKPAIPKTANVFYVHAVRKAD